MTLLIKIIRIVSRWTWRRLVIGHHHTEQRLYRTLRGHLVILIVSIVASVPAGQWTLSVWPSVVGTLMSVRTWTYLRLWTFNRHVVSPVMSVLDPVVRHASPTGQGLVHVDIPRHFRDIEGQAITVHVPMDWTPEKADIERVSRLLRERLHVDTLSASWTLHGRKPYGTFTLPAKPADMVSFTDMVSAADMSQETELTVGQGTRGQAVSFDLSMESPHMLIAGGSGAGKSEFLAWLVGQLMRRGYGVACLDAKFVSHMWLRQVPGVLYASESEELHEALLWLDDEVMRRARHVSSGGDADQLVPLVAVLEEMNGATNRLRAYWKNELEGKGMSPALTALGNLSAMGRELRVHILMAGQSMTGKATAGPENRENFGGRALARATSNAWRMLAPQIKPIPARTSVPGRWHLVAGDTLKEFQAPFVDIKGETARLIAWATGGEPLPDVPAMMLGVPATTTANARAGSSEAVGVSLRDFAISRSLDLGKLREWKRSYSATWPDAVAEGPNRTALYDPADLDLFVLTRTSG